MLGGEDLDERESNSNCMMRSDAHTNRRWEAALWKHPFPLILHTVPRVLCVGAATAEACR